MLAAALAILLLLVNTEFASAAPRRVVELTGRGCSAPLWGYEDRMLAFTTLDLDELHAIELADRMQDQKQVKVAAAKGVGRRFVFDPDEEALIYRRTAEALSSKPERLVRTGFTSKENKMLTGNSESILGPYRIGDEICYRAGLDQPLSNLSGEARKDGPFLLQERLVIRDQSGSNVWTSPESRAVEGFELSPDGGTVAVVLAADTVKTLYFVDVATGRATELGDGRWPSWSGDSKRLVYVVDRKNLEFAELVVYDLPTAQKRSVQGINQFWPDEPALNQDGTLVAFVHRGEIYITEVTGF